MRIFRNVLDIILSNFCSISIILLVFRSNLCMEFGCFIFGGPDWAAEADIVGTHRTKFSAPVTVSNTTVRCQPARAATHN
jgi:hypothetical protein